MARLGLFGGTFNPVHYGHLRAAEEARETMALERVIFIPSGTPPLKDADIAPARHRLEMAQLAAATNPFFEVSGIECAGEAPSYTVKTLEKMNQAYPGQELFFIIGVDAFLDIHGWWMPERLVELADFILVTRPGADLGAVASSDFISPPEREKLYGGLRENPLPLRLVSGRVLWVLRITGLQISASALRAAFRRGASTRYLLPETVESYIISNGLYTGRYGN